MLCYKCGCELSEKDFCTNCGEDVLVYKKIMYISNRFYNEGLEKANVRDLSGAVVSLRQALKFNKNHVEARNLLGLVYYEMGEFVAALSEWVISKNIRPSKNVADDYIEDISANPETQAAINLVVKKYNMALAYCYQDSIDLAIIQLKKVVSMSSHFVQAYQLLALLYIQAEEWDKAKKILERILKVDVNNTTTLRYLKEVNLMLGIDDTTPVKKKKSSNSDVITYVSGNETIIQPRPLKEPLLGSNTIVNIIIGIVIGLAACYFLVVPARVQSAKKAVTDQMTQISENADKKTAEISDLEQRINALTEENTHMKEQMEGYTGEGGTLQTVDGLLMTATTYLNDPDDLTTISEYLYSIDRTYVETQASEAYRGLYNELMGEVGDEVAEINLENGVILKNQGDYSGAIARLQKAWYFDGDNPEILFYLAEAYQQSGDMNQANELYSQLITNFPDSEYTDLAEQNVANGSSAPGANQEDTSDTTD